MKYQSIVAPDGITFSLCGPFAGAIHDQNVFDTSNVVEDLQSCLDYRHVGRPLYTIYGDPAYRASDIVRKPIRVGKDVNYESNHLII